MPTAVLPLTADSAPNRKRFTRADVNRMQEAGLFEGQRFELIDGDLIDKMGQKPPHATGVRRVHVWLAKIFGVDLVQMQLPIDVAVEDRELNEPEPDVTVLVEDKTDFTRRHPRGDETLLVVEVADSSIRQDTVRKRDLYARAGVPEYWILNIQDRELIVHRGVHEGRYREILTLSEGSFISPVSRPGALAGIDTLLP